MQPPGGLQTNHRRPNDTARSDQPLELINTIAQHRQRDRLADQSPLATGQPHSIERLARIDRNNKRARGHLTAQQLQGAPPSSKAERKTLPASAERVNPKPTSETYQRSGREGTVVQAPAATLPSAGRAGAAAAGTLPVSCSSGRRGGLRAAVSWPSRPGAAGRRWFPRGSCATR